MPPQKTSHYLAVGTLMMALIQPSFGESAVTSLTLINADTDQPIAAHNPIADGAVLDLAKLPTRKLNVLANTDSSTVKSVRFGYNGNPNHRTESYAPFSFAMDEEGDYFAWTPKIGQHQLSVTTYSERNATGAKGTPLVVNFTVIDSSDPDATAIALVNSAPAPAPKKVVSTPAPKVVKPAPAPKKAAPKPVAKTFNREKRPIKNADGWYLIDDFEDLPHGTELTDLAQWLPKPGYGSATVEVINGRNAVAQIGPGQAVISNSATGIEIPANSSGVLYFKFKMVGDTRFSGGVFGMASSPVVDASEIDAAWNLGRPEDGSRPSATLSVNQEGKDIYLVRNRGRMNKAYGDMNPEIKPNIWYDVWVTIDNSRDEMRMYIQGGDFRGRTEVSHYRDSKQTSFPFQVKGALDLRHFVIANPLDGTGKGRNPRTLQVDEINFMLRTPPSSLASDRRR
ncbi:MAG: hypothetical protein AAFX93_15595 [Verrucomicrobiota bacterium]